MDRYSERINLMGTSQRERQLNRLKQTISNKAPQSLSCKDLKVSGVDKKLVINDTTNTLVKDFETLPNETVIVGEYIDWCNKSWLVIEADSDSEVYINGKIKECNYSITFQHPTTGVILSYPCITSSTRLGQEEGKVFTLGNNQKSITLPFDQITVLLSLDKRLYVDRDNKQVYKIISIDNTSHNGLIELIVEQDLIQNNGEYPDRPDLGVCNYVIPITPVEPSEGDTYSTINANNLITGINNEITPTFYNSDGTINTTVVATWDIIKPVGFENDILISYDGNVCNITLSDNYDLLGKTVIVNVSDNSNDYSSTTELTIGMGW